MQTFLTTIEVDLMLNQINKKIKTFDQKITHQNITKDVKKVTKEDEYSYLSPLYSTGSIAIDNHIQLITYFV